MATIEIKSSGASSTPLSVINSSNSNGICEFYEGSGGNGNLILKDNGGTKKVRLNAGTVASYINNGQNVGIGNDNPGTLLDVSGTVTAEKLTVTKGTVTLSALPDASTAPSGADLEAVVVDKSTGILYIQ